MSLRDKILKARDLPSERMHIPEWDTDIEIRGLSVRGRLEFRAAGQSAQGEDATDEQRQAVMGVLFVNCVYDPDTGERVFTTDDLGALYEKSNDVLERVGLVALRLSGIAGNQQETAEKN